MSSVRITVASPPTTAEIASEIMAAMAAQSGIITDYNQGSQFRTMSESLGSVVEIQGVSDQALAFQTIVYGAMSAFGVTPLGATSSIAPIVFSTNSQNPFPSPINVPIPAGTLVQSTGGIQFSLLSSVTLVSGASVVSGIAQCLTPGTAGNVPANSINSIITPLSIALSVNNPTAATGGQNAETPTQTLSRFTSVVLSLGRATPVSIANAVIETTNPGTTESVKFSQVYEPWIANLSSGAGYVVYIDNGSGSASQGLINAVISLMNGSQSAGQPGYRPAGVPYQVLSVTPVYCSVVVSGSIIQSQYSQTIETNTTIGITQYFQSLLFSQEVTLNDLLAVVAQYVSGYVSSYSVVLYDNFGNPQPDILAGTGERIILTSLNVTFD